MFNHYLCLTTMFNKNIQFEWNEKCYIICRNFTIRSSFHTEISYSFIKESTSLLFNYTKYFPLTTEYLDLFLFFIFITLRTYLV